MVLSADQLKLVKPTVILGHIGEVPESLGATTIREVPEWYSGQSTPFGYVVEGFVTVEEWEKLGHMFHQVLVDEDGK